MKIHFRKIVFWTHLVFGITAGLIIALLCLTGAILTFESEVLDWVDREVRTVEVPASDSEPLAVEELLAHANASEPDTNFTSIEASREIDQAWKLSVGRGDFRYLDPYTGTIAEPASKAWDPFFSFNLRLHRWLVQEGESRVVGKHITGAANLAFLGLAISGLILWFPRVWRWKAFRAILLFRKGATGKTRDFNWHNVFGFWALIPIVVMVVTGTAFSYRWARPLFDWALGPSISRAPLGAEADPSTADQPIDMQKRLVVAQQWRSDWESIQIPLPGGKGRDGRTQSSNILSVKEGGQWFPQTSSRIAIDSRDGAVLAGSSTKDWTFRQKLRASIKGLHTGEAGLLPGKVIAFFGCLAGLVLVYTGFALTWRRFRNWKDRKVGSLQSRSGKTVQESEPVMARVGAE